MLNSGHGCLLLAATCCSFHTHILRLPIVNGPTEGLALFYIIFLSISITGTEDAAQYRSSCALFCT